MKQKMKVFFIFQQTPKLYPFSTRENIFFPAKKNLYLFVSKLFGKQIHFHGEKTTAPMK